MLHCTSNKILSNLEQYYKSYKHEGEKEKQPINLNMFRGENVKNAVYSVYNETRFNFLLVVNK